MNYRFKFESPLYENTIKDMHEKFCFLELYLQVFLLSLSRENSSPTEVEKGAKKVSDLLENHFKKERSAQEIWYVLQNLVNATFSLWERDFLYFLEEHRLDHKRIAKAATDLDEWRERNDLWHAEAEALMFQISRDLQRRTRYLYSIVRKVKVTGRLEDLEFEVKNDSCHTEFNAAVKEMAIKLGALKVGHIAESLECLDPYSEFFYADAYDEIFHPFARALVDQILLNFYEKQKKETI